MSAIAYGENIYLFGGYSADRVLVDKVYKFIPEQTTDINNRDDEISVLPNDFLFQNYPNPFNPITNIEFNLENSSNVKVIIYDILGREVDVLINERLSSGPHKIEWNGSESSSGIYLYKLITNNYSTSKKMILIK